MSEPTHAEQARTLVARAPLGSLSTLATDPLGYPFGSVVAFALDSAGDVILLTSDLAEHTHNFRHDPRASLLVTEARAGIDPLALGRVTLLGDVGPILDSELEQMRALYLERHPGARGYIGFKDFHLFRLAVRSIRYVGGFGRMSWVSLEDYRAAEADPLAEFADGIRAHMNEDHREAMILMVAHQHRLKASEVEMAEVDRYGFTLRATTEGGSRRLRFSFSRSLSRPDQVRQELVGMTRSAREAG